jgi:hypothetical protein
LKAVRKNGELNQSLDLQLRESNDLIYFQLPVSGLSKGFAAYGLKIPLKRQAFEWVRDPELSRGDLLRVTLFQSSTSNTKAVYKMAEKSYHLETQLYF